MTIGEVVNAMNEAGLDARHDKQNWGDWIVFANKDTVISIESMRGLASSATVEDTEDEEELSLAIIAVFRTLKWDGEDEDGRYSL